MGAILAAGGSAYLLGRFPGVHRQQFTIFVNIDFLIGLFCVACLIIGSWLLSRRKDEGESVPLMAFFGLGAVLVLWVLLTEEIYLYWYCRNRFGERLANWRFLSYMYISVMWAVYSSALMVVGFWKNIRTLRYIGLGLFALLLAKIFILDTSAVKSVYRITAFLATGISLVAVSYLYQFLKKKGFFDAVFADKSLDGDTQ
jgi:uncharacterized membrane protein